MSNHRIAISLCATVVFVAISYMAFDPKIHDSVRALIGTKAAHASTPEPKIQSAAGPLNIIYSFEPVADLCLATASDTSGRIVGVTQVDCTAGVEDIIRQRNGGKLQ